MSTMQIILFVGLAAFNIAMQVGRHVVSLRRFLAPALVVAAVAYSYKKSVPTAGGDLDFEIVCTLVGIGFGLLAGSLVHVERDLRSGKIVMQAGLAYAAVWVIVFGGRHQTVVREGLETILGLSPGIEVVGAAADGEEAVRLVAARRPDIVLMDLRMPRLDGVEATRRITRDFLATRVVVLTTYADDESIVGALEAGALGYLTKDSGAQEIQRAIRTVHAGEALLDPAVQLRVIRALSGDVRAARREPTLPDDLTPREAEVLRLIAQGLNNREIAERLFATEATVKTHINNIFGKAGLRDRAQAVVYAIWHGLAAEA